jgi:hypothetical protein
MEWIQRRSEKNENARGMDDIIAANGEAASIHHHVCGVHY